MGACLSILRPSERVTDPQSGSQAAPETPLISGTSQTDTPNDYGTTASMSMIRERSQNDSAKSQVEEQAKPIPEASQTDTLNDYGTMASMSMTGERSENDHAKRQAEEQAKLEKEITVALRKLTKGPKDPKNSQIVLPREAHKFWSRPSVAEFYRRQEWYCPAWDYTNPLEDHRIIMSILIIIGFRGWPRFKSIFLDHDNRSDKNLPFEQSALEAKDFLGEELVGGSNFYEYQWLFCPLVIEESSEPKKLTGSEQNFRFPFVESGGLIGSGSAGIVYKHVIPVDHIKYQSPLRVSRNCENKEVACKRVQLRDVEASEFENLRQLRGFLATHTRIMVNIATIIRHEENVGDIGYIFYDTAAYSLEVFLKQEGTVGQTRTERHMNDRKRRHSSAKEGRNGSHDWNEADLISESYQLADALDFLHRRLYSETSYSLAHNDLKPDNILVFYPDMPNKLTRFPVGQWKIADFGLAKIKERVEGPTANQGVRYPKQGLDVLNPGLLAPVQAEKTHRSKQPAPNTSYRSVLSEDATTKGKRPPGMFTPPELEGLGKDQIHPRSGDVWSFGCILANVLAFAVDPRLVDELRKISELPNYGDQRFVDKNTRKAKEEPIKWLQTLHQQYKAREFGTEWVEASAGLICTRILLDQPRDRYTAGQIRDTLQIIHKTMKMQSERAPLQSDLEALSSSPPEDEAPSG